MGKHYDNFGMPSSMKRKFDVYNRISELNIDLGSFDEDVVSLKGAGIAGAVIHESGLVYMSGYTAGDTVMSDDDDVIKKGQDSGQEGADVIIRRLHWVLSAGKEGDLNDVLYTIKALAMVVSPGGGEFMNSPQVANGFSFRWHSVFGGGMGAYANDGIDQGGYSGVHARSAIGGFDGSFSIEPEIIVAIPVSLAKEIIENRGWVFPLPPDMLDKIK